MFLEFLKIPVGDPVAITFFMGYIAMFAASIFFFIERGSVDGKWKLSLLVSGLITFIAAVHYYYMKDFYVVTGENPTALRYIDWTLTVPLMCVEFFLILKVAGAKKSMMWRLIFLSVIMLVTGYFGEAVYRDSAWLWGLVSGIAYFVIVYDIWLGEAKKLAEAAGGAVLYAHKTLCWFVLVGWEIYPLGYMAGTPGWYSFIGDWGLNMDVIYNIGDAVNKIGFGLVVYNLALQSSND